MIQIRIFIHTYLHICNSGLFEVSDRITTDFNRAQVCEFYLQVQLSSALTVASIWNFLTEHFPVRKCQFVQREIFHENVLITMTFLSQTEIKKSILIGSRCHPFWTFLEWNILILFPNYFAFRKVCVAFDTFFIN